MFDAVRRPSRRSAIATLLLASAGTACGDVHLHVSGTDLLLDDLAERYVRLTLRLAQHQPSLVETWLGPGAWRPGARQPVAEIRKEIVEADVALGQLDVQPEQRDRHRYLEGQFKGLLTAARRLSGETMRFADEAKAAFGIDGLEAPVDESMLAAARAELETRLAGRGPLHERYAAFRLRHALAHARVMPTFLAAMKTCRARVLPHIPLPETEHVEVEAATGLGLEARAVYEGDFRTRVALDISGPIDLARLLWLAAHETYPGHHAQHVLADRDCVGARGWHERALFPAFGPHLLYAEGAAEGGAALLLDGETWEEVCREVAPVAGASPQNVSDLVAVHRAVATLDVVVPKVAQAYLDGEIGSEVAARRLTEDALVANPPQFLGVIERQRTRLLAYPIGRRIISSKVLGAPPDQRWRRLALAATVLKDQVPSYP